MPNHQEFVLKKPHEMACPAYECEGRVEAFCGIWFNLSADGLPHLHGIGWVEGGTFSCSIGGQTHIPPAMAEKLTITLREFCASLEEQLGSETKEDELFDL